MRSRFGFGSAALAAVLLCACRPSAGTGAMLKIETPDADQDADVYVDGNYIGQVSELGTAGTRGLKLAPGVHRLEVRKPGRFPVQKTLRVPTRGANAIVVDAELLEDPS